MGGVAVALLIEATIGRTVLVPDRLSRLSERAGTSAPARSAREAR